MAGWPRFIVPMISMGLVIISLCSFYLIEMSMVGNIAALGIGALGVAALGYSTVYLVHDPASFSEKRVRVPRETRNLWKRIRRRRRN